MTAPTGPLTYTIEQAAERLGKPFTVAWLKGHINEIPKVRVGKGTGRGGRIGFTAAQLAEIVELFTERPEGMPAPSSPDQFRSIVSRRAS